MRDKVYFYGGEFLVCEKTFLQVVHFKNLFEKYTPL